jgi:uncharacterized protein (TIGR03437 family)
LKATDNTSGLYFGTWYPQRVVPQASVDVTVEAAGLPSATVRVTGQVSANAIPVITAGQVRSLFNPSAGGALAPGSLITISGEALAAISGCPSAAQLPFTLAGTSVTVGGIPAPLSEVTPLRLRAQVPFELAADRAYEMRVSFGDSLSAAEMIELVPAAPALVTEDDGTPVARHANFSRVSASSPAQSGEEVNVYLTGMGATNPLVATGASPSAEVTAEPLTVASVTVNGIGAAVQSASLLTGSVGIYELRFRMPAVTAPGVARLTVSQAGITSNAVELPVQP